MKLALTLRSRSRKVLESQQSGIPREEPQAWKVLLPEEIDGT